MTNIESGLVHNDYHPIAGITRSYALKAAKKRDPNVPTWVKAMSSKHHEQFEDTMDQEILELIQHDTWDMVQQPCDANVLPGTWAFCVKRYPDGCLCKFKAQFCVHGNKQIEGVDYFEKYAPVVAWSRVCLMMTIALHLGMAMRQIDFSNAFVQATMKETVYVDLPCGYAISRDGAIGPRGVDIAVEGRYALKLKKLLYSLVQAPMYWGKCLKAMLERHGFKALVHDACFYSNNAGMVVLTYCDDCLFFHKEQAEIDKMIQQICDDGLSLTVEDDAEYKFIMMRRGSLN